MHFAFSYDTNIAFCNQDRERNETSEASAKKERDAINIGTRGGTRLDRLERMMPRVWFDYSESRMINLMDCRLCGSSTCAVKKSRGKRDKNEEKKYEVYSK